MAVETDAPPESPDRPRPERGRIGRAARRFRRAMPSAPVALACIAVGALLAGSLPPWGVWPLAFVGIAGLDVLLGGRSRGSRAGRMGFVALTLFGISLFWIKDLSAPGYVIAIFAFAAMFAAVGTVVPPGRGRHVALPGAWVVAEAWKGHWPFGGVPISDLAIGQVTGPLADLARLGGVELLSGATVAVGVILAAFIVGSARGRVAGGVALVALVALTALSSVAPHGHDVAHPVRIAAVQGGGPQGTRAIFTDMDKVFQRHLDASDSIRRRVDVIVWPEDVVDLDSGDIADADSGHGTDLSALARDKNATVIAGVVEDSGPTRFLNFSVVIHPDGTFGDRYEKVHRVPYGEYVPLRSLVTPFAGPALTQRDAVVGKGPARLRTAHGTFGVV
ncbi:MAG: hypothetical protein JST73_00480, partial [Actinobacteria bacterium]|nr:hypothetical protein [Actinomycetota bacterium]